MSCLGRVRQVELYGKSSSMLIVGARPSELREELVNMNCRSSSISVEGKARQYEL